MHKTERVSAMKRRRLDYLHTKAEFRGLDGISSPDVSGFLPLDEHNCLRLSAATTYAASLASRPLDGTPPLPSMSLRRVACQTRGRTQVGA